MPSSTSPTKAILQLAIPLMLAALAQTAINQVAQILAGHLPTHPVDAQTAVNISQSLLWIFSSVFAALGVATQVWVARNVGAQQPQAAGSITTHALVAGLFASLLLTALCFWGTPALLRVASPNPTVVALGIPFARWRFATLPAMILTAVLKGFFDGQGQTSVGMRVALFTNLLNLLLGVSLMFGSQLPGIVGLDSLHHALRSVTTLPAWGLTGAGISAAVASYAGLLVFFVWSLRGRYRMFVLYQFRAWSKDTFKRLFRIAIPSGLADASTMISFLFLVIVVGYAEHVKHLHHPHGSALEAGVTSNIISILLFVFMSCIAYGATLSTLVSQALGGARGEEATQVVKTGLRIGVGFYSVIAILLWVGARSTLRVWNTEEPFLQAATPLFRTVLLCLPLVAVALALMQAMYGAGSARFVMRVQLALQFLFLFPLCYVLTVVLKKGMWGAWSAMLAYAVGLASVMYLRFRFGAWRQNQP